MSAVLKDAKPEPKMTIYRYEHVELEVGIEEFEDDALLAELQKRKLVPPENHSVSLDDLVLAMQWGNHAKAIELLREYLMNETGKILP